MTSSRLNNSRDLSASKEAEKLGRTCRLIRFLCEEQNLSVSSSKAMKTIKSSLRSITFVIFIPFVSQIDNKFF